MSVAIITGSSGLIGAEAARHFGDLGLHVVGVDNDMRAYFFGDSASTRPMRARVQSELGDRYEHHDVDIRNKDDVQGLFARFGNDISVVIHTAAQPSHDWAAKEPHVDFGVNAVGTLNLLEAARLNSVNTTFIFTSTNKVYGDAPNRLPFVETKTRWELPDAHPLFQGVPESFPIDQSLHSLFGASKVAADVLVQEYGRYFGMRTVSFRGGCLTGPGHAGAELHGFLAYLMRCTASGERYRVFGYKGKQVRDNIHSHDLVRAFDAFFRAPGVGRVYNIGGGRSSNCSMLEAIELCQEIAGRELSWSYVEENRIGDHIWWVSDLTAFRNDYPDWDIQYGVREILEEIYEGNRATWE